MLQSLKSSALFLPTKKRKDTQRRPHKIISIILQYARIYQIGVTCTCYGKERFHTELMSKDVPCRAGGGGLRDQEGRKAH